MSLSNRISPFNSLIVATLESVKILLEKNLEARGSRTQPSESFSNVTWLKVRVEHTPCHGIEHQEDASFWFSDVRWYDVERVGGFQLDIPTSDTMRMRMLWRMISSGCCYVMTTTNNKQQPYVRTREVISTRKTLCWSPVNVAVVISSSSHFLAASRHLASWGGGEKAYKQRQGISFLLLLFVVSEMVQTLLPNRYCWCCFSLSRSWG